MIIDHFVVANPARIPCTARTLRPFSCDDALKPWVSVGQIVSALEYLAFRAEMTEDEQSALKELHAKLYSLLKAQQGETEDSPPANEENTNGH